MTFTKPQQKSIELLSNDIADKGMTVMDIADNRNKQIIRGYAAGVNTYRIKSVFLSSTQQLASGGFKDFR